MRRLLKNCPAQIKKVALCGIFLVLAVVFCSYFILHKTGKGRTFFIAVDRADPDVIQELIAQKKLPHFEYVIQNGSYGIHNAHDVCPDSIISPMIWTSVATGMLPEQHGITEKAFWGWQGKNSQKPSVLFFASSEDRKEPAIWNIYSDYDRRVAMINWWLTYPAEKVNGFVISSFINEAYWAVAEQLFDRCS